MALSWHRWRELLADERLPAALVDLDAVDLNAEVLLAPVHRGASRDGGRLTARIASKSIRCVALLRRLLDLDPCVRGLMTFSATETVALWRAGFDDLLLAYPVARRADADALAGCAAEGATLRVVVDDAAHVRLLSQAATARATELSLCLDVDLTWRPLGDRAHLGVRRSPIRTPAQALALARCVAEEPGVRLDALLGYEAAVAGLADVHADSRLLDPARRVIKARSRAIAWSRRASIAAALEADGHRLTVVNGGGSGSVDSTASDGSVTEVTLGSGFLCPHLFDGYSALALTPAAFFAVAVSRRPSERLVTCAGGGFTASGEAGPTRLPRVHLPAGMAPLAAEGWGEVQTPLTLPRGVALAIGDPVIARHAKAGELMERFSEVLLLRGGGVEERAKTYRGAGWAFG